MIYIKNLLEKYALDEPVMIIQFFPNLPSEVKTIVMNKINIDISKLYEKMGTNVINLDTKHSYIYGMFQNKRNIQDSVNNNVLEETYSELRRKSTNSTIPVVIQKILISILEMPLYNKETLIEFEDYLQKAMLTNFAPRGIFKISNEKVLFNILNLIILYKIKLYDAINSFVTEKTLKTASKLLKTNHLYEINDRIYFWSYQKPSEDTCEEIADLFRLYLHMINIPLEKGIGYLERFIVCKLEQRVNQIEAIKSILQNKDRYDLPTGISSNIFNTNDVELIPNSLTFEDNLFIYLSKHKEALSYIENNPDLSLSLLRMDNNLILEYMDNRHNLERLDDNFSVNDLGSIENDTKLQIITSYDKSNKDISYLVFDKKDDTVYLLFKNRLLPNKIFGLSVSPVSNTNNRKVMTISLSEKREWVYDF